VRFTRLEWRSAAAGKLPAAPLLASLVIGCLSNDSDYFGPYESTWVRIPVARGEAAYVGITVMTAHEGEVIVLDSVDFEGREGDATIEPLVAAVREGTGLIGAIAASDIDASIDLDAYRPASGVRFAQGDGEVALAVRITGTSPVQGFESATIRFRTEGSSALRVDQIPLRATVCSGLTVELAIAICDSIEDTRSFGA
jgi:hypothetical protein